MVYSATAFTEPIYDSTPIASGVCEYKISFDQRCYINRKSLGASIHAVSRKDSDVQCNTFSDRFTKVLHRKMAQPRRLDSVVTGATPFTPEQHTFAGNIFSFVPDITYVWGEQKKYSTRGHCTGKRCCTYYTARRSAWLWAF